MIRQLRYRDSECTFPGCGLRRFTQAHHVRWWDRGGTTDLDNLVLICSFHHTLVHEHGWSLRRAQDGAVRWFHPDGRRYRAGPAPPREEVVRKPELMAVGTRACSFGSGSQTRERYVAVGELMSRLRQRVHSPAI